MSQSVCVCFPRRQKLSQKRCNVGLLYTSPDMSDEQKAAVGVRLHAFGKTVEEELLSNLTETPIAEHWVKVSTALVTAGEQRLRYASRSNLDWFLESQDTIAPLLQQRDLLYNRWVRSGLNDDHSGYKAARSKARTEIRRAKTHWFDQVASKADLGHKTCHGASVWSAIRTIQRNHQGLRPVPAPAIRNENGVVCESATEQLQRWQRHFEKVLNVRSCFDMSVFDLVVARPVYDELDDLPSMEDLQRAIRCVRNH